jgi:hypothetical protein
MSWNAASQAWNVDDEIWNAASKPWKVDTKSWNAASSREGR